MRIAFTGASSTGKTTLAKALMTNGVFRQTIDTLITTDAQVLIEKLGYSSIDKMSADARRHFRISYFETKRRIEQGTNRYLTDRSFVDIAAYWVLHDNRDEQERWSQLVAPCRQLSTMYDIHFFFPNGLVPQELGGRRSFDRQLHEDVSQKIHHFLTEWNLQYIELSSGSLAHRVQEAIDWIRRAETNREE